MADLSPPPSSSVEGLLAQARDMGISRLDAMVLIAHVWEKSRTWLVAHHDAAVPASTRAQVVTCFARRRMGAPIAYLTGTKEFRDLDIAVTPAVLVPRPETEGLVDWALDVLRQHPLARPVVVDLGTGSGAIALAIKKSWPQADVHATDASEAALEVARHNGKRLGLDVTWHHGHWWQAAGLDALLGRLDLAISNPPYIPAVDPHLAALSHEPQQALIGGEDGLDDIRAIVRDAPAHLVPRGRLMLEHGFDQGAAVRTLLQGRGFVSIETRSDLAGHERCTGGAYDPRQG